MRFSKIIHRYYGHPYHQVEELPQHYDHLHLADAAGNYIGGMLSQPGKRLWCHGCGERWYQPNPKSRLFK